MIFRPLDWILLSRLYYKIVWYNLILIILMIWWLHPSFVADVCVSHPHSVPGEGGGDMNLDQLVVTGFGSAGTSPWTLTPHVPPTPQGGALGHWRGGESIYLPNLMHYNSGKVQLECISCNVIFKSFCDLNNEESGIKGCKESHRQGYLV